MLAHFSGFLSCSIPRCLGSCLVSSRRHLVFMCCSEVSASSHRQTDKSSIVHHYKRIKVQWFPRVKHILLFTSPSWCQWWYLKKNDKPLDHFSEASISDSAEHSAHPLPFYLGFRKSEVVRGQMSFSLRSRQYQYEQCPMYIRRESERMGMFTFT